MTSKPSPSETLLQDLKKIFTDKTGALVELNNGMLLTVIPHSLGLNGLDEIVLTVSDDGVQNLRTLMFNSIVSVSQIADISVPEEVSSSKEFWSSRFFQPDFRSLTISGQSSSPPDTVKVAASSTTNPYLPQSTVNNGETMNGSQTTPSSPYSHKDNRPNPPTEPILPSPAPKNKNKLVLGLIVGFVVVPFVITGGVALAVFSGGLFNGGFSSGYSEEYDEWIAASEEWYATTETTDYYNGQGPVKLNLDNSIPLTEYDYYGFWTPYLDFDDPEAQTYTDAEEISNVVLPEGWKQEYFPSMELLESLGYPIPEELDSNLSGLDVELLTNGECSIFSSSSVMSVTGTERFGTSDSEVTGSILSASVDGFDTSKVNTIKISQWYEPGGYVEFQEYVYVENNVEIHYAVRALPSNGRLLMIANTCGVSNSNLFEEGLPRVTVDAYVGYPFLGSERKP